MGKVVLSAVTTFLYVACSTIFGVIMLLRKYGDKPDWTMIVACLLLATIATVKDIRATNRMPPLNAIDMDQLRQFVEEHKHEN